MLCVALALVFAGASAASVVDKVQHQGPSAQVHEHMAFSVAFEVDHHIGDHGNADYDIEGESDDATTGHQPGAGHHHHADGPTGVVASGEGLETAFPRLGLRLSPPSDYVIRSPASPGPERPPKPLTTGV